MEFTLADGTSIKRSVSECRFEIRGAAATSPVVLGEEHDGALLGAVTLETLGFMLNPLTRRNSADADGSIPPTQLYLGLTPALQTDRFAS